MSQTPGPTDDEFAPTGTRPASLWPASTRVPERQSTGFASTRFDPMAEERARLQAQAAAAFDVCHPALALRAVLLVQAALAVVALAGAQGLADWGARQAVLTLGGVVATVMWLVLVCALKQPLRHREPAWRATVVLGAGAVAALLAWAPMAWAGLAHDTLLRAGGVGLAGLACAALLWAWLDLRSRMWQPANAAARLAELQSRIRPHFLFNALNTALALVRVDPARAEAVLEDLAELFRVALAEAGASVSLEEEIELARRYLAIEEVRFGRRLTVEWEIDPRVHAARVPPLVLQPLVENAVRHGIEPSTEGGRITVRARLNRGQVVLVVSNTLGDEPGSPGHGMALHNIRERLRLLHDVAAECDVRRENGLFQARIVLPAP
ncbi:MAG: histidine kinase [Rubrivivax sp.]|nr:histidine kinase [Rubrivivax sp.]